MSFAGAPVTRNLVLGVASASIGASLFDIKHYFYILVDPQILRYNQVWRALTYQLCYTNSSEVLFSCIALYQLRIVERMWGSRKLASFIAVVYMMSATVLPLAVFVLRFVTRGRFNYLPAGPTSIVFAILAQYYSIVPHKYTFRVAFSAQEPAAAAATAATAATATATATATAADAQDNFVGLTLSDKSYRYFLATQLALFQWPGSLLMAGFGWVLGHAWRNGILPGRLAEWRIPGWMAGLRTAPPRREEFEGLRRRLEDENTGSATGVDGQADGGAERRRPVGQQILDQFRGPL